MDLLGTYRGYEIGVNLYSNGDRKSTKWHSSIQINLIGRAATKPHLFTEELDSTLSKARERAVHIAMALIDKLPGVAPISDGDLSND